MVFTSDHKRNLNLIVIYDKRSFIKNLLQKMCMCNKSGASILVRQRKALNE
jgi:hypothetical protein